MFDHYLITVTNKNTNNTTVFDEVLLFGLCMHMLVASVYDPTHGQGKMSYRKVHAGLISKLIDKFRGTHAL